MKGFVPYFLIFSLFQFFPYDLGASEEKILLVVHSYAMDYRWTVEEDQGIQRAFNEYGMANKGWKIKRIFLDTKKRSSGSEIQTAVAQAKKAINQLNPDAALLTDDDAFKNLFRYLRDRDIPLSFAGINGDPITYGYLPGEKGITGSLERHNIAAVVKIMKQLRPTIKNILLVAETSLTGQVMMKAFSEQIRADRSIRKSGINRIEEFIDSRYEQLLARLKKVDPDQTGVIFITIFTFKDKNGNHIPHTEVNRWVDEHTSFIDVACATFQVQGGRLLALGANGEEMGHYSAKMLFESMVTGRDPSTFPVRQKIPLQLTLNYDRAKKLNVEFPFDLMAYAGLSNIVQQGGGKK